MKKKRRENEAFSIAFLDVITCGFGAIILLLMITRTGDLPVLDNSVISLDGVARWSVAWRRSASVPATR